MFLWVLHWIKNGVCVCVCLIHTGFVLTQSKALLFKVTECCIKLSHSFSYRQHFGDLKQQSYRFVSAVV